MRKKKIIYNLLFTICLIVFLYSGFRLVAYYFEYKHMNEVYVNLNEEVVSDFTFDINTNDLMEQAPDVDMEKLLDVNEEICGYILIPDTRVSYPIAYSKDELKYLNYDIYNNRSRSGSIFVEPYDDPDFTDSSTIIHGHNMANGTMFGQLREYVDDEQFFRDHPYIYIITTTKTYLYRIFSASTININDDGIYKPFFTNTKTLNNYVNERLQASKFQPEILPKNVENIITLSTCTVAGVDYRTIVQAYLIDQEKR